jgi:hypothetical protein
MKGNESRSGNESFLTCSIFRLLKAKKAEKGILPDGRSSVLPEFEHSAFNNIPV